MSLGAKIKIISVLKKKKKNATISSVLFRCHGGGGVGGDGGGGVTVILLIFNSNQTKMPSTKTDTSMRIQGMIFPTFST